MLGPWLVWFCGLGLVPQTERPPVRLPVTALAWVADPWVGHIRMFRAQGNVSFSFSLPPPSLKSKIKINFKKRKKKTMGLISFQEHTLCHFLSLFELAKETSMFEWQLQLAALFCREEKHSVRNGVIASRFSVSNEFSKTGGFVWWLKHISCPGAAQVVSDSLIRDEPLFGGQG